MVTVDEIAIDCQKDIAVLLAATISEDSRVKDFLRGRDIQQMQERYDQWAGNLGALQQLGSPLSLEYRLRDAPLIRESILNTLENLHISMQAATDITTGKRPNRVGDPSNIAFNIDLSEYDVSSSESDTSSVPSTGIGRDALVPTSEIQELLAAIETGLDDLFKSSIFIRKFSPKAKRLKAAETEPFDSRADIMYVEDKYSVLRHKNPALVARLGEANARRRQYFKYRRDHNERLSTVTARGKSHNLGSAFEEKPKITFQESKSKSAMTENAKASSFVKTEATALLADAAEKARMLKIQEGQSAMSTVSFVTSIADSSDENMLFPPIPAEAQAGSPFLCPYCLTIQQLKRQGSEAHWKKHVLRDLEPYICTFSTCGLDSFESQHAWFEHELQVHRSRWVCSQCFISVESPDGLERHIRVYHPKTISDRQLSAVVDQSKRRVESIQLDECPFCVSLLANADSSPIVGEEVLAIDLDRFRQHLGRHLEETALFALPRLNQDDNSSLVSNNFRGYPDQDVMSKGFRWVRDDCGRGWSIISRRRTTFIVFASFLALNRAIVDAERERLLEKLAYVADAPFDSYENKGHSSCLENTRVEVLQQIMQWATSTSPRCIFWLKGMAGIGKSTVAITVARQLRDVTKNVASYFFKRGSGDLAHARKIISTIVWQLSHSSPSYCRLVLATVKENPDLGHSANLREQYEKLLIEPLGKLQSLTPTQHPFFVIIDALDECNEENDLQLLLRLLATTNNMSNLRIRFFVTSRPELPIRLGFQEMPSILHQDLAFRDLPRSVVDGDIEVFLRNELKDVQRKYRLPPDWPGDSDLFTLITKAGGLFIFARTACRYIGGSPQADPQERLEQICSSNSKNQLMTQGLDQLYTIVLQNLLKGRSSEKERQRITILFRHVVGSIVVLFNPLSIPELFKLLFHAQLQAQYQLENILESLHAVLDVRGNINSHVQLLHLSFRGFLLNQKRCLDPQFWVDEQQTHHELALNCMRLLSSSLKQNICRLPSPGTLKSEIAQQHVDNALSPAVQYACRYWVDHVQIGKVELLDHGYVHEFLRQHFLHWLEAMSLMTKMSEAIIAINKMSPMVTSQTPIIHDLIHDCRRFVLAFRHAITNAPEQLYVSALIFSPLSSTVRKVFSDTIPRWVKFQPLHREERSYDLQTLEGHSDSVNTVAFSPDGQLVASGSADRTVRLWNALTGECCALLEGHSNSVNSVTFSPDGRLVASASNDHTIRLWSPDGRLVASASNDPTRLWETQTGECYSLLEGHSDSVNSVIFSPDGQLVASGSADRTVRLWNAQTGECCSLLEGHSNSVNSVTFSPDCQLVASASNDHAVRLWDAQTGKCYSPFEGHSDSINSVIFSPDGKLVASASNDHTVRLWDVQTSECCSILEGHSNSVNSVTFSPDCQLVASASNDYTVRLWDVQTGESHSLLQGHSKRINEVVFSPDGRLVALGSADYTVRLCDALAGECRSPLEGHSGSVNHVVFSPDGQLVASWSRSDRTVRLWDAQTGGHVSTIPCSSINPQIEFRTGHGVIFVDGTGFEILPAKITKAVADSSSATSNLKIHTAGDWLLKSSERVLWLPPEYRSLIHASYGNTIVIGLSSGQVIFFSLEDGLD